jgi:hypothetical protein
MGCTVLPPYALFYDGREFSCSMEVGYLYGTAPYTARFGQNVYIRFRMGCSKFGRDTFHQLKDTLSGIWDITGEILDMNPEVRN